MNLVINCDGIKLSSQKKIEMKKFLLALLILLLVFLGLTYWSISIGPSELFISKVIPSEISSGRFQDGDRVTAVATNRYEANAIKRFMQGDNYREAWEAPVQAEIFLLDSFTIQEEGGGNQTKSLKIVGKDGALYSLRSINKDPSPLIPEVAKTLGLENIVVDGISAQHPYGAVLAAALADAAGILHTHPKIVFVPRHDAMGKYSKKYGNRLFLREYETEGKVNWTSYNNVDKIVETDELQEMKINLKEALHIDHQKLVRARLFDLLIGDWDRHTKQWGWVIQQRGQNKVAIPLPGDRDNAFFRIDGVIPTILTNHLVQPMVRPFEKDIDHIPGFVYPFDVYFLKDVPRQIFIEEAQYLQQHLTDTEINKALEAWPQSLVQLNGNEIASKLKHRRDKLQEYAKEFHEEINKKEPFSGPLKGSEEVELPANLQKCFECR
ncbi:hypothetical protein VS868_01850 [Salinimicrobium sp. 3283s]|uniref:hypothetical protein n=1 Tax=Salinimicrobium sp. 3283s TaxID=3114359 RepID=UPI0031EA64E4